MPSTTKRARISRRRKRGVSSIIGMVFFILIIFVAFTALTLMFNSFVAYNNTVNNTNRKILLDQQTSLSVSGFTFGSPISSQGTPNIPGGILYYVPITLSNSQSSAVSGNTPVMLNLNWNSYSTYLDNPVDNLLFFDASGNSLNSWIENGTANTLMNSIVWVQLNSSGIPANSAITIYLGFYSLGNNQLNAAGPTGEAPQLTSTYAEYDDGSQVFSAYFDGNTPVSQFTLGANMVLAQATGVSYGTGSINALQLTGSGTHITMVYNSISLSNVPMTAESNFETQATPTSQGAVAFGDNANAGSSQNAIGVDQGYGVSYFSNAYELNGGYTFDQNQQGTATSSWEYASVSYSGSGAGSWNGYISSELYLPSAGYSGTINNNPLSGSSGIYLSTLSDASASYPNNMYYNWMRARVVPPNGVMPLATFGSVVSSSSGVSSATSTVGSSSGGTLSYLPVTLTNSQGSPTPNPFQEQITWNPSLYTSYEASNLGNIRFCADSQCNTPLYSWLQSCSPASCSSSGTSGTAWVRLTSSIAANGGTLIVYMVFTPSSTNFDGNYWGEAPTLSPSYGQYDNGANVFTLYDNFAGNALSGIWTPTSNRGGNNINNGITFTTSRNFGYSYIYSNTVQQPQIAEAYMVSVSGDSPLIGVETQSGTNGYGMYNGYSLNWYATTDRFCPENSGGTGNCITRTVNTFPAGIWSVYWAARGVEGSTDGAGNAIASADNSLGNIANYGIYLGVNPDSSGSNTIQWARMRAYPPNNVMPSSSFGPLVPSSGTATSYSFERKVVYSQGLWWAFYSDGSNIGYSTSADGGTWSGETTISSSNGASNGYDFNMWLSGTTLYYVLAGNGQSNSFHWRYGTLQSSGSISWSIPERTVTTTNNVYSYNSIAIDSSGNVWVAVNTNDGTNTHIEVWEYSVGVWTKVDDTSPLQSDATPILVPLSVGIALIYGDGGTTGPVDITTTTTGSSWTPTISPPSDYMLFSSSATAIGNTVYFAGLASGSTGATIGTVKFWTFAGGSTATSAEASIQSSSSSWVTTISEEPTRTLVIFYGSGSSLFESYSVDAGATWYPVATISASETGISGLTSPFSGGGALWTSGSASPYEIRFSAIPSLTATNNSPFPVQLISLYIYNIDGNSLVHFDVNPAGNGVKGPFDYWLGSGETMSIPLTSFTWTADESYLLKVTTDQGVMTSFALTSPA